MTNPLIAIVGSIDPSRNDFDPPLEHSDDAQAAAEQIGYELAKAGCRLLVYSSASQFVEAHVVKGYVESGSAQPKAIQVRFPLGSKAAFAEYNSTPNEALFAPIPDPSRDWEASFYRSLRHVDGVVLVGGGRSTFVTGHIALAFQIPVLALATFGGSARKIWAVLSSEKTLASDDEIALMASARWSGDLAKRCVDALLNQRTRFLEKRDEQKRQERKESRKVGWRALVALILLLASIVVLPVGLGDPCATGACFRYLLFLSPILAGTSGSTIRLLWSASPTSSALRTAVLGAASGAVASVLYVVAQVTANPQVLGLGGSGAETASPPYGLLVFAVVIGFIAGFTFDAVYSKLATMDALRPDTLTGQRS